MLPSWRVFPLGEFRGFSSPFRCRILSPGFEFFRVFYYWDSSRRQRDSRFVLALFTFLLTLQFRFPESVAIAPLHFRVFEAFTLSDVIRRFELSPALSCATAGTNSRRSTCARVLYCAVV